MSYQSDPNDPWGQQPQPGWGQQPPQPGYGQQPPGYGQTPPGYQPYPNTPGANEYGGGGTTLAGWGYRVGASLIDGIIVGVVAFIVGAVAGRALYYVVLFLGQAAYQIALIGSQGRTVGNMALGTTVLDANTGGPVGYGKAALRWLIEALLSLALVIGFLLDVLWPLWDAKNQTLHDKAASTVVVLTRR